MHVGDYDEDMKKRRYLPLRDFPRYLFIPGKNPHPKKAGGHMEGEEDPKCAPINTLAPETCEFLRYSLDLYNHGYFWEAHVYMEALWNAHEREGSVADFLKALIKLSAAGVKININQNEHAEDHFKRAKELLETVIQKEGPVFLGFNLESIIFQIDQGLRSEIVFFEIHPDWE